MSAKIKTRIFLAGWIPGVLFLLLAVVMVPYWSSATSTYTEKLGLEMPERGDVGWDDAIRINYKITEAILSPQLDGHSVASGATPTSSGGLLVSWAAGTVKFKGNSYTLASGTTTIAANTVVFLSAVTLAGSPSGATIQARSGEYYPPSGASGYFTPIAVAWTAVGSIERLKDVRYMPAGSAYSTNQNTGTADDVRHNKIYVVDLADTATGNFRTGVSIPSGTSPTATPTGSLYADTNDKLLQVGADGVAHGVELLKTYDLTILSPDLVDQPTRRNFPLFTVPSGVTFYLLGVTVYADTSGVTVPGISYSATQVNMQLGAGTTLFNFTTLAALSGGVSVYGKSYSGVSVVPQDRTVMADLGYSSPGYVRFLFTGRLVGARP